MEMKAPEVIALIGDIIGSRRHPSRRDAQEALMAALATANEMVPGEQPWEATIGDEFQSVHRDLPSANRAALIVRLSLPASMDVRIGMGRGSLDIVGDSPHGLIQDGPAWWAARDAIIAAKDAERRHQGLRTWLHEGGPVNAYLLVRDHLVSGFDDRQRRILLGLIEGRTQREIAESEGISPSAISQTIHRQGIAAVLDGLELIA